MKLGALLMGTKLLETDSTWRRQPRHLQFSVVIVCLGGRRSTEIHPSYDGGLLNHRSFSTNLALSSSRFPRCFLGLTLNRVDESSFRFPSFSNYQGFRFS